MNYDELVVFVIFLDYFSLLFSLFFLNFGFSNRIFDNRGKVFPLKYVTPSLMIKFLFTNIILVHLHSLSNAFLSYFVFSLT